MVQYCKYSPNSTCRPSSCLLAVLAMLLANSSPISSRETSEMLRHFVLSKQLNLVLRSSRLTVQFSGNCTSQLTSFFNHKILPNLVGSSWL